MAVPFETLESITTEFIIPEVVDQLPTSSPAVKRFMKRKRPLRGGTKIEQPVQYAYNTDAGAWKGGFAVLPFSSPEIITKAQHDWTYYQCPIVWSETDLLKNMGEAEVADYAEALAQNGLDSLRDTFGRDLFKDGSLNAAGAPTLDGLSAIITHNANPSVGSYGGISRASSTGSKSSHTNNAWWNGNSLAIDGGSITRWTGTFNFSNASTVIDLRKMNQMFILLPEPPDIFITSLALFGKLWDLVQAAERIPVDSKKGDTNEAGSRFIMINGTPVVPDTLIDDENKIYAVNFKYIFLRTATDFEESAPRVPTRQRVVGRYIWFDGQLTCSKPNAQLVATGATAQ